MKSRKLNKESIKKREKGNDENETTHEAIVDPVRFGSATKLEKSCV